MVSTKLSMRDGELLKHKLDGELDSEPMGEDDKRGVA